MTKYEVMYILSSGLADADKEALIEKFSALVKANGGEVESVNKWGNRRLAYPINYKNEGYYVLMTYSAPTEFNAELERNLRIHSGDIMRFMITKKIINSKTPAPKAKPVPVGRHAHAKEAAPEIVPEVMAAAVAEAAAEVVAVAEVVAEAVAVEAVIEAVETVAEEESAKN